MSAVRKTKLSVRNKGLNYKEIIDDNKYWEYSYLQQSPA